jgi:hypothetical protein
VAHVLAHVPPEYQALMPDNVSSPGAGLTFTGQAYAPTAGDGTVVISQQKEFKAKGRKVGTSIYKYGAYPPFYHFHSIGTSINGASSCMTYA